MEIRKVKSYFLTVFSIVTLVFNCSAQEIIYHYKDSLPTRSIGKFLYVYEDVADTLRIQNVSQVKGFKPSDSNVPNLGITPASVWLRMTLHNTTREKLFLEIPYPILDEIVLFEQIAPDKFIQTSLGENKKFEDRIFDTPDYIFQLNLDKGDTKTYYLKLKAHEQILAPVMIGTAKQIFQSMMIKDLLFAFYCGLILAMFFYNIFLFFSTRERLYLFYVLYIIIVGITQITLQGYAFKYLWPDSPEFVQISNYVFPSLVGFTLVAFMKEFLQTKKLAPRLNIGLNLVIFLYGLCVVLALLKQYVLGYKFIQISGTFTAFYMLVVAYIILKKGYKPAKYFFIGWFVFLVGVILFALKDFGVLPFNYFTNYTMQAGTALEAILLSFALADRINILKKEKEASQQKAFEALKENDRIIREQNVMLDQKVKERTVELEKSNGELASAIKNLKDTQAQLVSAEKMASLGQLTAGVAHEINNPINFVTSGIKPLRKDIAAMWAVLEKYKQLNETNFKEKQQEINKFSKEVDIDYIKEEIDDLLKGIDEGANRTSEIVKGLKTFSRLDEADLKQVDLNEGIESTLIILGSILRDKISVEKNYGNIPKVECYAGKMNQVFMNIISNSIHAVQKMGYPDGKGKITITTKEEGDDVIISIRDNGTGIPQSAQSKIFDPFFTTKDVGEGTGLGLSIAYNIVENHKGKINFVTEEGNGTEFIIKLPKLQVVPVKDFWGENNKEN